MTSKIKRIALPRVVFGLLIFSSVFFDPGHVQAGASCTYAGSLSWGDRTRPSVTGSCSATVNETVADGAYKDVASTNPTTEGVVRYQCLDGVWRYDSHWCNDGIPAGSCKLGNSGLGRATWVVGQGSAALTCSDGSPMDNAPQRILNGAEYTFTNRLPGLTGSIVYKCTNGQWFPQGAGTCSASGSGGGGSAGGGGVPTPNPGGGGSGGGTPTPQPPACIPDGLCTAANTCWDDMCRTNCGAQVKGVKICGPTITSFTVDKTKLAAPGPVTLKWTAAAVTSCLASGG